jgi:hypothetical protein
MLGVKKITLKSFLINSLIIFFGIPMRIIRLAVFFYKTKKSIRDTLLLLLLDNYLRIEDRKIEFINKQVYLNCSTKSVIYSMIRNHQIPGATAQDLTRQYFNLKALHIKFKEFEDNLGGKVSFKLGQIETRSGIKIKKAH